MKKIVAVLAFAGVASAGAWFVTGGDNGGDSQNSSVDELKFTDFDNAAGDNQSEAEQGDERANEPSETPAPEEGAEKAAREGTDEAPTDIKVLSVEQDDPAGDRGADRPQQKDFVTSDDVQGDDEMQASNLTSPVEISPKALQNLQTNELRPKIPQLPEGALENIRRHQNEAPNRR